MILHRLLEPHEDIGACRVPIDARLWLDISGWRYVKCNRGGLVSSNHYRFTAWLVGIANTAWNGQQGLVDTFEKTRQRLTESIPDLDGTVAVGPVIETKDHRYMLCVPQSIVEQGGMVVHGWTFPEAI